MSMEDLAAITMVQPAVSEADEHAPSTPLPSNTSTPRCRSQLGSRLSLRLTGFETLLGQLRAQYVTEVSELHAHLTEAHAQITRLTLVRDDMEEEMEKIRSENEDLLQDLHLKEVRQSKSSRVSLGEQLMTCSMESVPSSQKTFPTHVNAAMAKRHEQLPTVNADQVLEVMDDERASIASLEALFKETDMRKGVLAADEYASESDSEIERRLKRLPRVERARIWFQSNDYEMLMALSLSLYVVWMAFELQFYGVISGYDLGVYDFRVPVEEIPSWDSVFQVGDACFTAFYGMDVIVRMCLLRKVFWHHCLNYVDVAVALASTAQLLLTNMPINPVLFRLLRLGKLARAIRMLHMTSIFQSLQLLVKCLVSSSNMLFWSFILLVVVQSVAGLMLSTLCMDFIMSPDKNLELREAVFRYYGTFSRTFLTMFEIMFANWSPPCRVLVEHISEWFSVFFLLYRCVLGFAVLNIINAVFVQQTMKTASSDEELAFKQREKEIAAYTRKVKKLFQTMDASGNGAINLQEFAKLVQSPKLKFWMGQLELEYHDMLSLFEFLDNGDGEITLLEFIDGACRLRGQAKALDVWRLETKLEVLLEEVINRLALNNAGISSWSLVGPEHNVKSTTVQQIFNASSYSHIKSNHIVRQVS
ncbi:Voltage-dependent T-type calcium channel subunit alpha-1H [Durusdinium trenchii]|uniref:Voltage-dependent T-type calcium channel subunit alpha-1H n=1 Tax=Durusdinium trenchii TaxID=1381693 RepID=A0ABP0QST7_9DINO